MFVGVFLRQLREFNQAVEIRLSRRLGSACPYWGLQRRCLIQAVWNFSCLYTHPCVCVVLLDLPFV